MREGKKRYFETWKRTLQVFPDPIPVNALWQNDDPALNVPRDYDLSGCDSHVFRNLFDLEEEDSEKEPARAIETTVQSVTRGFP